MKKGLEGAEFYLRKIRSSPFTFQDVRVAPKR